MNILYVTARALEVNASSSIRNIATIKGLLELNHKVTVCSLRPNKNDKYYDEKNAALDVERIYFEADSMASAIKVAKRFNIFQTKLYRKLRGKWIYDNSKQIINHISEIDISKFDLIISSSDPKTSHLFVEQVFEKYGKRIGWIQIWGDPFAADMTINGSKGYIRKIEREERRILSKCDSVVYVSAPTMEDQKRRYPESAMKMHYLPIPYLKEKLSAHSMKTGLRTIKIAYCGDYLSNIRNIKPLYEAVSGHPEYDMRVCGDSDLKLESADNIHISGRVPYQEVCEIEDEADILVLICNISGNQIPGKIYQYSGTDKPILFVLDGNVEIIKEQFGKYNRYDFCGNDVQEIGEQLKNITNKLLDGYVYAPLKEFRPDAVASAIIRTLKKNQ